MTDTTPDEIAGQNQHQGVPENVTPGFGPTPTASEPRYSPSAMTIAILWGIAAVILGIVLLTGAKDETYGADAYTGIQNAVTLAVRGIAFLLFGSAALGLIIAVRRDRR